jgi:iron complex outermembrane receptor protein
LRTGVGVIERLERSPYALWDIYLGLPRHKVHPYVQVSNATNTSYQSIPGVAMPGRTIVGGVEVVIRKR